MKICMMTNTYLPHVGGVARSVSTFAEEYRQRKHQVLVIAPEFEGKPLTKRAAAIVERVAAIQNFNGSDFSVRLPLAATLSDRLDAFQSDIIHTHHPFLLGDTALRVAATKNVPVIFTHHTRYEDYTHYVPFDSPALKQVAINLSTEFANLCDGVIAPSESIAKLIKKRGVTSPIRVVPTGIDVETFASGDGARFRKKFKIPAKAFVVGHLGRLAPEKNLGYLAEAVALFVKKTPTARFLVVGGGPSEDAIKATFAKHGAASQLILAGKHSGRSLADAYNAMDVFAFASFSETQGMVLAEAMAAGRPVVALNASGVREVMRHGKNGFMLPARTPAKTFAAHLARLQAEPKLRRAFSKEARRTAEDFSKEHCAELALAFYEDIRKATRRERLITQQNPWGSFLERLSTEWNLIAKKVQALTSAVVA
ncbi:glycosyltransferase [Rariglobus hedericola]|uniref:Glycosyltransferase family 4 protein n=1 Tax=Rariglobus hedericola TaxID=2597822 RepID=A0A556QGL0_9BACT|nr:glycosyltransferase [Rariglobus hedericola]TSJ75779.1 glycosyltransferase family 4 protein [Rariglobus hedericola]